MRVSRKRENEDGRREKQKANVEKGHRLLVDNTYIFR